MNKQNPRNEWFTPSESSNIKDSLHKSRVSRIVEQTHSINVFYLTAGLCQVFLGLAVVAVCVLGLLQPVWLSTVLIMIASVTTMIGLYLLYITVAKTNNHNSLLRNAMRRVMESQN